MMRFKTVIVCLLLLFFFNTKVQAMDTNILSSQKDSLNISSFVKESNKYTKETFPELDVDNLMSSAINGDVNNKTIYKGILNLLGKEVKDTVRTIGSILVIIVIHSILKSISDGFGKENVSQIAFYVEYILIVTVVMANFVDIINMAKDAIENMVSFMYTLIPILITLMISTGNLVSSGVVQPILLFLIEFIGNMVVTLILPLLLIGTVLGIISNISDKVQIGKLSKYFKTSILWFIGILFTVFIGVLSLEGTLSASVDGITAKTAKAAVSSLIPVVGKFLGDAVDTVIGCASILKNAVGFVGVIVILSICIAPIIKLTILTITYHISSAIVEPIADEKIVKLLESIGETFKILLGILCGVSFLLIIGMTLVIKISNSGLMYR